MAVSMGSKSARPESRSRRPVAASNPVVASNSDNRVLVGEVHKAHGLRGEVKVVIHSDIAERFDRGSELLLVEAQTRSVRKIRVRSSRPVQGGLLVGFEGISYRDQAEALRGSRLEVEASEVPEAPEGLYYYFQLQGCRCVDAEQGELGEVVDVIEDGGGILLEVAKNDVRLLLPFVDAFLVEVDIEGQRIDWNLPPGLVETCASKS